MEQDRNTAVESYRRRIREQAQETERLQKLVRDLEKTSGVFSSEEKTPDVLPGAGPPQNVSAEKGTGTFWAKPPSGLSGKTYLSPFPREVARAEADLKALRREYALFRLREAIGEDPGHVESQILDEVLVSLTSGRLTRGEPHGPRDGRIGFATFRALLLANLPLGQLAENERAERRAGVFIEAPQEETSTESILCGWAAMAQPDPYVANILKCAGEARAGHDKCLAEFARCLESLRINYELKQRKVDRLAFAFEGGRPAIVATNYWENVEQVCSQEVRQLIEQFHGLEQARAELRDLRDELNGELRAFLKSFAPRYITYAMQQSPARQQSAGLRRANPRRLCRYLVGQIERTDFLAPRDGHMEIAVPRIPPELSAFRRFKSYQRYKRELQRAAMADASTIEYGTQ